MNIDLLITSQGEAGLVCDKGFKSPVAGIMFDTQTGFLTMEFADTNSTELNIPVAENVGKQLLYATELHIGVIENEIIADNRQVPLVLLNDPFGGGNAGRFPVKPRTSVMAFENFMKRTTSGQPVHRDDLGDEARASSVMGGINATVLQFAPHLARQRNMEAQPNLTHAPKAPGMNMGGGGGAPRPPRPSQSSSGELSDYDDE